jgi:hypothetical protein
MNKKNWYYIKYVKYMQNKYVGYGSEHIKNKYKLPVCVKIIWY